MFGTSRSKGSGANELSVHNVTRGANESKFVAVTPNSPVKIEPSVLPAKEPAFRMLMSVAKSVASTPCKAKVSRHRVQDTQTDQVQSFKAGSYLATVHNASRQT